MTDRSRSRFNIKNLIYTSTLLATSVASVNAYAQSDYDDALMTVIETSVPVNGQYLPIRFTLNNISDKPVKILKWNTPLEEGFNANMFEVSRGAEKIEYIGRYVQRVDPAASDYITIQPGESVSNTVDISEGYKVNLSGDYNVSFSSWVKLDDSNDSIYVALDSEDITAHMSLDKPVKQQKTISASYQGCADIQVGAIKNSLVEAEAMAYDASQVLKITPENERSRAIRYKTWFGRYTESNYQTVTDNYEQIYNALVNKAVSFDCTCPAFTRPNSIYAYVYANEPYNIFLCEVFWRVGAGGKDSKGGTIIHEMSHFSNVAGAKDYAYGHKDTKQLAKDAPTFAINNAESYDYFAENTGKETMGSVEVAPHIQTLSKDQAISGSLKAGKWQYFQTTDVTSIDLYDLSGNAGLYVKSGSKPSLFDVDCKPNKPGKTEESCQVNPGEQIYLGVYSPVNVDKFTLRAGAQENTLAYPKKGLWWNPQKNGSGFDIELSGNNLSVIWYTYDKDTHPVWYLASAPYSGHGWKANIKQYSWNGQSAASTDVGVMEMSFSSDMQAKLSWALDGHSGDENLSYLSLTNTSSDPGYSGIWYQPANPGSGVTFVDQGSVTSAVLYFYDAQGKPRWALSNASGLIKSSPGDYSYQLETYLGGSCPYCAYSLPRSVPVGELVMDLSSVNNGRLYTDITLKAPLSGSWEVNDAVIENLAP